MSRAAAFIAFAVVLLSFVYIHEVTHFTVAESYGCDASIDWVPDVSSVSSVRVDCSEEVEEIHRLSQDNVEAVGYQVFPIYVFLGVFLGVVFY